MAQCHDSARQTKTWIHELRALLKPHEELRKGQEEWTKVQVPWKHLFQKMDQFGVAVCVFGKLV